MPLWEGKVLGVAIGVRLLEPRGRLGRDAGSCVGKRGYFLIAEVIGRIKCFG